MFSATTVAVVTFISIQNAMTNKSHAYACVCMNTYFVSSMGTISFDGNIFAMIVVVVVVVLAVVVVVVVPVAVGIFFYFLLYANILLL